MPATYQQLPTQSGEVTQNTSRNTFGFPFWLLFVRLFQALPTLSSTYYETIDNRQLVKDPFGSSSFQEKPVKNNRREKRSPEHVSKQSKGEEPGVSTVHEEIHNRGVGDGHFATSQMVLADKIVKIAWKESEE